MDSDKTKAVFPASSWGMRENVCFVTFGLFICTSQKLDTPITTWLNGGEKEEKGGRSKLKIILE